MYRKGLSDKELERLTGDGNAISCISCNVGGGGKENRTGLEYESPSEWYTPSTGEGYTCS